jgi:hypothetical protein
MLDPCRHHGSVFLASGAIGATGPPERWIIESDSILDHAIRDPRLCICSGSIRDGTVLVCSASGKGGEKRCITKMEYLPALVFGLGGNVRAIIRVIMYVDIRQYMS